MIRAAWLKFKLYFYVALGLLLGGLTFWSQRNRRLRKRAEQNVRASEAAREIEHGIQEATTEARKQAAEVERSEAQRRADGRRPDQWGDPRL